MGPDEFTIKEEWLRVVGGHRLYVQDWGNIKAKQTIIYLHGGPGAGVSDGHKQTFDPKRQRVIFFDQRGAGRSHPKGSLKDNTTDDLVSDIEAIASKYNLKSFVMVGGSWGSTLALVYAIRHPEKVDRLYLRGIFSGRPLELDFLDNGGYRQFYPDIWHKYLKSVPKSHQDNPSGYHFRQMLSGKKLAAKKSAYAYCLMEGALLRLDGRHQAFSFSDFDPSGTIIEAHYLANNLFLPPNYIFDEAAKLTMPVYLIQGRYDMVCPPITAYELNKLLPNGRLIWTAAGHSGSERSFYDVLIGLLASEP